MNDYATPWWLIEQIENNYRKAKRRRCGRCRVDVWAGLDDDVMAVSAVANAKPVSVEDGFRAVLDGLDIYSLSGASGGGKELWRRDEWNYAEDRWPCLVQHRCPPREETPVVVERHPRPPEPIARKSRRQQRQEAAEERPTTRRRRSA